MDIGWGDERCIHCLGVPNADDPDSVMTRGHVIPQSLGGKLYAYNECKRCNDRAGHGAEAALIGDPAVRAAAELIAEQIPGLIRRMRQRKVFIAQSDTGLLVRAAPDDGDEFKILQTRQPDGSRTASMPTSAPRSRRGSPGADSSPNVSPRSSDVSTRRRRKRQSASAASS